MYKQEFQVTTNYINNFYDGSIHDLVFLDLEWCRDFRKEGLVNNMIFGYTITRILEGSSEQYIKIQFIESRQQEKQILEDILADIQLLQRKYFVGYGISTSDISCLRKRIFDMRLPLHVREIKILDLQTKSRKKDLHQGLNSLFEHLGIQINKKIKGEYVYRNGIKVLRKEIGHEQVLNNIYEYCLEDATNYFNIVTNWQDRFPLVHQASHVTLPLRYSS
ncbi:ribonuclease H-like domain-containing protein [Tumidithrix elongata RA019]|uniref:Ribonuclease H-like domain-containing protein n=1 Tax=Tumidithrix elongata BACA0141 TaxID=2716417 RepID=A0AAW9Q0F6_9CYAN|nr:ribonuclease H-like domain-containing protein [Tumidithrix elongata RA019]